uniref:Dehydrogenase/reductase SDR family member 1 isoform X1 n=2 Tax=Petromyzon marinus TaxID=7757 RepID=A0AAJ7TB53_PETMA|nr:dehydrogenase/reductase SDR family member 1 isoform X1 [Petromyzon marinus]XP_032813378.1 dehydrogenase/reductase SDR family member 1 isoform X1 [Petromyzon marinus]
MAGSLSGQVCIVTGASRGIGKGIALQLAEAGATVYITGRNQETLRQAAEEVEARGGHCVPVSCDSTKEEEVRALFERVRREQKGRLDILVNNAYAGVKTLFIGIGKPFWEQPATDWDDINNTGLRGHYLCSVYASQMMVELGQGLIVVISSIGGLRYHLSVPYGVGKAACDRLAADCAVELRKYNVAYVSLWPGAVRTELVQELVARDTAKSIMEQQIAKALENGETTELSGKCIVGLAKDKNIMKKSGRVVMTADLASEYGFKDVDVLLVMAGSLSGQVCIVTGASRGIGKGIALQLAEAGATVYITGRNQETLRQAAEEVEARGGRCVPVSCDSTKEEEVRTLFERVRREQKGRLDILVNNAYAGVKTVFSGIGKPFWEQPATDWDDINNTGLRGHYLCSVYASQMMVELGQGLIVVISSMGGLRYLFSVPYGVGKAACDRLAADCAVELRKYNVAYVSLWPGAVRTELVQELVARDTAKSITKQRMVKAFENGETTELSGKCIVGLAKDKNIMKKSGRVLMTADLASEYGLKDVDGSVPVNYTSLKFLVTQVPGLAWMSCVIPSFIKVPKWMLSLSASKF